MIIKDSTINLIVSDPTFSDKNNTDTVYTNVINDDYVNELKEVKFKVSTWDNKKPNYSAVAVRNQSSKYFLDKTYNISCYKGECE